MTPTEPNEEKIIEAVKKYYGLKIDENAYQNADIYAYEETTVDGYSVYIVTHDMKDICVSEDVYYYDSDVAEAIMEMVRNCDGYCTMYSDQYFLDDIYFDNILMEDFAEIADQIYDSIINDEEEYNFTVDEVQWLKEEFTESEEINKTVS
jgi:L-lactate utilization protein LutC